MDASFILIIAGAIASQGVSLAKADIPQSLAKLVSSLTRSSNTELTIISDFSTPDQKDFAANLGAVDIPLTIFEIDAISQLVQKEEFANEPCPLVGPTNASRARHSYRLPKGHIITRRQLVPVQKYHRSILVWTEDLATLDRAVKTFDKTVLWCDQYKEPGLYHRENRFYFFTETLDREETLNIIFSSENMKRHPKAALIQHLQGNRFGFWSHDFFHESRGSPMFNLNGVSSPDKPTLNKIFTSLEHFYGHTIRIAHVPYVPLTVGTWQKEGQERGVTYHRYTDLWGYDMEILWAMQETLNFTYETFSDPDFSWGSISEDEGKWSGITGYVESGFTDIVFGGFALSALANMVTQPKWFLEKDFLTFASPPPLPKDKIFTIALPFGFYTWISILCSTVIIGVIFYVTTKIEDKSMRKFAKGQSTGMLGAVWICFATLLQESLPKRILYEKRYAMRPLLAGWLLYCLVMSESYSGNLKAVLTRPEFIKSAESIEDVVSRNFIWQMVKYDNEDADFLAASTDPDMIKLREGMKYMDYEAIPELKDVYGGNTVRLDWYMLLETAVHLKYMTADGKPMVHLDPDPVWYPSWNSWAFFKMTPWFDKFDDLLTRLMESGLVNHWKERTWMRIKAEEGIGNVTESPGGDTWSLEFEHFYGFFALYAILVGAAGALLLAEVAAAKWTSRGHNKKGKEQWRPRQQRTPPRDFPLNNSTPASTMSQANAPPTPPVSASSVFDMQ